MSDYAEHPLPKAEHERRDVSSRTLAIGLAGVGTALVLLAGLALWLYPTSPRDMVLNLPLPVPAAPRLQESPAADMRAFYAQEMQELNSTGWVDRAHGIVRIPIGPAMRLVVQEGIADWPAPPRAEARRCC